MSDTESFKSILELARAFFVDNEWSWGNKICARLKAAHEREIAQARDPQRLRGTKPDTFNGAIEALREFRWQHATNDEDAILYINAVKEMHDREIRATAQQQYDRGFRDGRHSMDAEHRAIAMRLRGLRFDGGSHENLSRIAYAIYPCATGWTCESADGLRDKLIDLMGGVSDDTCGAGCCCAATDNDGDCGLQRAEVSDGRVADDSDGDTGGSYRGVSVHLDGLTGYDVLWNERRKAIAELRQIVDKYKDKDKLIDFITLICATDTKLREGERPPIPLCNRLIHLLGGDECTLSVGESYMDAMGENIHPAETSGASTDHVVLDTPLPEDGTSPNADGTCPNDDPTSSITDELRKWASDRHCKGISHTDVLNIGLIADRIDEQFDRICQQQEAVLQETIDEMVEEYEHDRLPDQLRIEKLENQRDHWRQQATDMMNHADAMEHERDELQAKLDKASRENKGLRLSIDEQKESIAQRKKTIGKLTRDNTKVWETVHELQAKLDEYDSTHVELPRDENDEVFRVDGGARVDDLVLTIRQMTLTRSGWKIRAYDENYEVEREASFFDACAPKPDLIEETIEKLTLGEITQSEAIERIKALGQE